MPYNKKYSKKYKKSYNKKSNYKKSYRVNLGKLIDKKANTLLETRMTQIAKKQARINNPALCLRRYCWVNYDPVTNKFNLGAPGYASFDWNGKLVNLTEKILKEDNATIPTLIPAEDPATQFLEAVDRAQDGVNVITTIKTSHGRRTGDQIFLSAYSLDVRIICDFTRFDDDNDEDPDDNDPNLEPNLYDKIDIHIALIKVRRKYDAAGINIVPDPTQILKITPWGYHSALDPTIEELLNFYSVQTLFRDKITITNSSELHSNIIFRNFSGGFKNPIKIDYSVSDTNAVSGNYDVFLVCRSTVAGTGNAEDLQSKPYVQVCSKLYYRNNK